MESLRNLSRSWDRAYSAGHRSLAFRPCARPAGKGWKRLVGTITAFTVAHSITLAAATLGFVHVPGPPVEACIALSIVFVAAEIIRGRQGQPGFTERAPWVVAFTFGLLHGLGFAGAFTKSDCRTRIPLALLFFNVGVEIGQLAFIAVVVCPATAMLLRSAAYRLQYHPRAKRRELGRQLSRCGHDGERHRCRQGCCQQFHAAIDRQQLQLPRKLRNVDGVVFRQPLADS